MTGGSQDIAARLALARDEDAQEAAEAAAAEARGWAALRGRLGELGASGGPPKAAPSGSDSGGGSGRPPQGPPGSGPRSGAVDALYHPPLTERKGHAPPPPPRAAALDLTPSKLLSQAIEERRRRRLATIREVWENRRTERARELAWYRFRLDELTGVAAAAEAAGAVAVDELEPGIPVRELLAEAAEGAERAARRLKYAAARVKSLSTDLGPRLAACEMEDRWIKCKCDAGAARPIPKGCAQRAGCLRCRKRYAAQARRRALPAVAAHMKAERDQRGRAGRVRMITVHGRHSGDVETDRAVLIKGWEGLRKQLHRWFGRALPFLLQVEVTPGADGKGHVHAHIIVIGGPAFWRYGAIQRTWRRVCPTASHLDIQVARSASGAAMYIAKYATKGAIVGGGWSDELTADVIAMHYGKRTITTSERFWAPREPICQCCETRVQRCAPPDALTRQLGPSKAAPAAWGQLGGLDPPELGEVG